MSSKGCNTFLVVPAPTSPFKVSLKLLGFMTPDHQKFGKVFSHFQEDNAGSVVLVDSDILFLEPMRACLINMWKTEKIGSGLKNLATSKLHRCLSINKQSFLSYNELYSISPLADARHDGFHFQQRSHGPDRLVLTPSFPPLSLLSQEWFIRCGSRRASAKNVLAYLVN